MSEPLRRTGAAIGIEGPSPRDKLRAAIEAHAEEKARVTALEEGRDRSRNEQNEIRAQLIEAERELAEARHAEQTSLAYDFINRQPSERLLLADREAVDGDAKGAGMSAAVISRITPGASVRQSP
jgi:hypothetical protein